MLADSWLIFVIGILATQKHVLATRECNAYNFAMKALRPCALSWWQENSFEQNTADLPTQLTDILIPALRYFGLDPNNATDDIRQALLTNSADPLRKVVETAALGEPYALYGIMDAANGFEMTAEEMAKLGLPETLADKKTMMQLYQNYFGKSCSADIFQSFTSCVNNRADSCHEEDRISVLTDIINNIAYFYCENKAPKSELMSMMNNDFGMVYADLLKSLGVIKVPGSRYVFGLSPSSLYTNETAGRELLNVYMSTCGYLFNSFGDGSSVGGDPFSENGGGGGAIPSTNDLIQMFASNSSIGIGVVVERLLTIQYQMTNCALRAWNNFKPGFFTKHELMFNHMKLINSRYGGANLSLAEPERGDIRHTVMVYGDPHMKPYKIAGTITCPALGSQIYLSNEYFSLVGVAEPACTDRPWCSTATYVTSVKLDFLNRDVTYITKKNGAMPSIVLSSEDLTQNFTMKGGIELENLGSSVRITDEKSAAVFMFSKFRHTYQIVVRMGESVFDNSLGLLIIGCSNPTDITAATAPALRKRRDAGCTAACMDISEEFRDTCVFDCHTTGDMEVANITKNIMVIESFAEEKDEEIYRLYPTTPSTTTSATTEENTGSDGNDGIVFFPSVAMMALMALLSLLI